MDENTNDSKSTFSNVNKLLLVALIVVVLIIIWQINSLQSNTGLQKLPNITPIRRQPPNTPVPQKKAFKPLPNVTPASYYYKINNNQQPINKLFFDDAKPQFASDKDFISEGLFQGKVIRVETDANYIYLILDTLLSNGTGKQVSYRLANKDADKISYVQKVDDKETPITLQDIKPGDILDILEANNYSKEYEDSIVSIKVIKK